MCLRLKDELGDGQGNLRSRWILLFGDLIRDRSAPAWTLAGVEAGAAFSHSANSHGRV